MPGRAGPGYSVRNTGARSAKNRRGGRFFAQLGAGTRLDWKVRKAHLPVKDRKEE
jgi:hypothetical protein